jgi:hypothetical protein
MHSWWRQSYQCKQCGKALRELDSLWINERTHIGKNSMNVAKPSEITVPFKDPI